MRAALYLSRITGSQLCGRFAIVLDIPSPCIGVCRLDPATGLCAGCMRTSFEIAIWPKSTNAMRLEIVQRLRERRREAGRTSPADARPRRRHRVPV